MSDSSESSPAAPRPAAPSRRAAPAGGDAALAELAGKIGHPFRDLGLLSLALNHRSYLNEAGDPHLISNERLEFLGDAVLGLLSADLLYRELPEASEGDLSQLRSALVRASALADLGRALDLGAYLRLGRSEETTGGRDREPLLAAAFEALVGAVYLDSDLATAARFVEPLLRKRLALISAGPRLKDDKSHLQELAQARLGITPRYRIVSMEGPSHDRTFVAEVLIGAYAAAHGTGHSRRAAEQAAASAALRDQGWLEES